MDSNKRKRETLDEWWTRVFEGGRIHGRIVEMRDAVKSGTELSSEMRRAIVDALYLLGQFVHLEEFRRFPKAGRPPAQDDRLLWVIDDLVLRYGVNANAAIRAAMGEESWTAEHKKLYDAYRSWKKNNPGRPMGFAAPGYDQLLTAAGARLTAATGRKQMDLDTIRKASTPTVAAARTKANAEIPHKTERKEATGRNARRRKPANADNVAKAVDRARAALRRRAFGEAGK